MYGQSQNEADRRHVEKRLSDLEWQFRRLREEAAAAYQPSFPPSGGGGREAYAATVTATITAAVDADTPGTGTVTRYLEFDGTDLVTTGDPETVYNVTRRVALAGETVTVLPTYGGWTYAPHGGNFAVFKVTTQVPKMVGTTPGTTGRGTRYAYAGSALTATTETGVTLLSIDTQNKIKANAYVFCNQDRDGYWWVTGVDTCANLDP